MYERTDSFYRGDNNASPRAGISASLSCYENGCNTKMERVDSVPYSFFLWSPFPSNSDFSSESDNDFLSNGGVHSTPRNSRRGVRTEIEYSCLRTSATSVWDDSVIRQLFARVQSLPGRNLNHEDRLSAAKNEFIELVAFGAFHAGISSLESACEANHTAFIRAFRRILKLGWLV